jgi:hypothetical protein
MEKKISLNEQDINQLEAILIELPFKFAQPLIQFMNSKVKESEKATTAGSDYDIDHPSTSDSTMG